jgi:ribose transport system permease protein
MTAKSIDAPKRGPRIRGIRLAPAAIVWLGVLVLLLIARIASESFWDTSHLFNVARQASALGILAIGQTFVLLTGGIDLSNGMVITLVNVVAATMLNGKDDNLVPVVAICLLIGSIVGLVNGTIITKLRVPPLVVTLGMFSIVRGIAYVYTNGSPKGEISPALEFVGTGFIGVVPTAVFFFVGFTILGAVILRKTVFGRQLYAVGGNAKASRLSGVRADRVVILAYVSSGLTAAVAGLILSGYTGTGLMTIGDDQNLGSIAAAVVGGTSLSGGSGSVIGTAGGALFLAMLFSFLRFIGLPYTIQLMMQGVILALAAYAHVRSRR